MSGQNAFVIGLCYGVMIGLAVSALIWAFAKVVAIRAVPPYESAVDRVAAKAHQQTNEWAQKAMSGMIQPPKPWPRKAPPPPVGPPNRIVNGFGVETKESKAATKAWRERHKS